jgi:hypothetical protein
MLSQRLSCPNTCMFVMCHNYSSPIDFCCRGQLCSSNRNKLYNLLNDRPQRTAHLHEQRLSVPFSPEFRVRVHFANAQLWPKRKENLVASVQIQLFIYQGNQLHVFFKYSQCYFDYEKKERKVSQMH